MLEVSMLSQQACKSWFKLHLKQYNKGAPNEGDPKVLSLYG